MVLTCSVTFNRYLAICRVFEFRITRKLALTVIVFIWICAGLIMSPWAIFFRQVTVQYVDLLLTDSAVLSCCVLFLSWAKLKVHWFLCGLPAKDARSVASHLSVGLFVCPSICPIGSTIYSKSENRRNFIFIGDKLDTSIAWEQIWGQKFKAQGHWERKCKNRFSCIFVKSGSIYTKLTSKWSWALSTNIWSDSGNTSFLRYLSVFVIIVFWRMAHKTEQLF